MVNLFFVSRKVLQRLLTGPLSSYINRFADMLSQLGYVGSTVRRRIRLVANLSQWLQRKHLGIKDLNEQLVAKFFKNRRRYLCIRQGEMATLKLLLDMLRKDGKIPIPYPENDDSPIHQIEHDFARYLLEERRLSQITIIKTVPFIQKFLAEKFDTGPVALDKILPSDITHFVIRHAYTFSPKHAQKMVYTLRSFFRFLWLRGDTNTDLAAVVPTVASWRLSTLPRGLESKQVEHLLKSYGQNTIIGQRNYTILLILARLGLRAGEVIRMKLDDIDWENGELVVHGKGDRQDKLPIPYDVGKALAKYLRYGRPSCSTRRVFVRMKTPIREFMNSSSISIIVQQALEHAGINSPCKGAHVLRHSLATNMLLKGAPMPEIKEILRHQLLSTTEIYAKVDLKSLRKLTHPWPGGAI